MMSIDKTKLNSVINSRFSLDELGELAFELNLNLEDLPGQTKSAKARALIEYMDRREALPSLVETIRSFRHDIQLKDLVSTVSQGKLAVEIKEADVLNFACDVLVLKYAQYFYGADRATAEALGIQVASDRVSFLAVDEHRYLSTQGAMGARNVLFIGTRGSREFEYKDIRDLSFRAMRRISVDLPLTRTVGMTMHGVGFGLDERESFLAQIAGIRDALFAGFFQPSLEKITIVERNASRASRLMELLLQVMPTPLDAREDSAIFSSRDLSIEEAGLKKRHVFIAMPFSEEFEDIFYYGIQKPVNDAGYLCERIDLETFTGDVIQRITERIDNADVVIADVSGANPNVYLEIGYAWGRKRPTCLIAKHGEELRFDIRNHRTIFYKSIKELESLLSRFFRDNDLSEP